MDLTAQQTAERSNVLSQAEPHCQRNTRVGNNLFPGIFTKKSKGYRQTTKFTTA
jgi:hypothetical protein